MRKFYECHDPKQAFSLWVQIRDLLSEKPEMEFFAEARSEDEVIPLRKETKSYNTSSSTTTLLKAQLGDDWMNDEEQ